MSGVLRKMIISHKHKFIFVKTRKTAGTSLEIGLSEHCGAQDVITPISPKDELLRASLGFRGAQNHQLPIGFFRRLERSFAGRHTHYFNHMSAAKIIRYVGEELWNDYFTFTIEREPFGKAISSYYFRERKNHRSIEDYIADCSPHRLSNWGMYADESGPRVDYVIRYENMAEGLKFLQSKLSLDKITMPRAKSQFRKDRQHYSQVLNTQARRQIEAICANEIRYFGYQWVDETQTRTAA